MANIRFYFFLICLLALSVFVANSTQEDQALLRQPSSTSLAIDCKELISYLLKVYPDQDEKFIRERLSQSKDAHSFFRSFVPYFYFLAKDKLEKTTEFQELLNVEGVMGGDVHVENFGILLNDFGKARLAINDYDDVTSGAVFLDVIRHLTSIKLAGVDLSTKKYLDFYLAGLLDKKVVFQNWLQESINDSEKHGFKLSKKIVETDGKPKFRKKKAIAYDVGAEELAKVSLAIAKIPHFDGAFILDIYRRLKISGGSAGALRYEIVLQTKDGKVEYVTMKEWKASSFDRAWFGKSRIANLKRFQLLSDTIFEREMNNQFFFLSHAGKDYLISKNWKASDYVDWEDLTTEQRLQFSYEQAYALGMFHKRGLQTNANTSFYVTHLLKLDEKSIQQIVDHMALVVGEAFKVTR